jgi:DNA-binding beta-propeller fold protein YncE
MTLTKRFAILAGVALVLSAPVWQAPVRAAEGPYRLLTEIKIGTNGGWDYASVDSAAKRLFVSHATEVVVIDTGTNTVVGQIAPTPGVHGIAVAPVLGKAFVSNGRENKAAIVDLKTLKITSSVETGRGRSE